MVVYPAAHARPAAASFVSPGFTIHMPTCELSPAPRRRSMRKTRASIVLSAKMFQTVYPRLEFGDLDHFRDAHQHVAEFGCRIDVDPAIAGGSVQVRQFPTAGTHASQIDLPTDAIGEGGCSNFWRQFSTLPFPTIVLFPRHQAACCFRAQFR